jgi:hypothetical protein
VSEPTTSDRNVNRVIRSWLLEDRHEDVSRVAAAVLDVLDTTPQHRSPWWPVRRIPFVNKFASVGLGAAAVVAALVIGAQVLGPPAPGGVGGPSATPSLTISHTPGPTTTTKPPPSPVAAPPLTQTFTSRMHGISVSYPAGWTARAATEPWTDRPGVPQFIHPGFDVLKDPVRDGELFLYIASRPTGKSTREDWADWITMGGRCPTSEPMAIDGATGVIGCSSVHLTTAGREYLLGLYSPRINEAPGAEASRYRAWFEEVLGTVQLHPEDAVG